MYPMQNIFYYRSDRGGVLGRDMVYYPASDYKLGSNRVEVPRTIPRFIYQMCVLSSIEITDRNHYTTLGYCVPKVTEYTRIFSS